MATTNLIVGDTSDGGSLQPFAFETITVSTAAIGPTAATSAEAKAVLVTNGVTNDLSWRIDGTAAADGVGHHMAADGSVYLRGGQAVKNLSMIRTSTGDCTVSLTYFK
jgi:hypothetical protein